MEHTSVVAAAMLPGIADLAPRPKHHFVSAFIAERTGNWLLAAFELRQAVAAEELESTEPNGCHAGQVRATSQD